MTANPFTMTQKERHDAAIIVSPCFFCMKGFIRGECRRCREARAAMIRRAAAATGAEGGRHENDCKIHKEA